MKKDTTVNQIMFDKKIRIIPGQRYTAKATISGGKTYFIDLGGKRFTIIIIIFSLFDILSVN